ncbi:MAG: glycoside hydrolase family 127 protein [Treponema sp.]|nr:glycoside hydrolase family 127 protein [Treponema sp.]
MKKSFLPSEITLLDNYYTDITQKMVNFLNTFNPDKLLFNFRQTAGLTQPSKQGISYGVAFGGAKGPYGGWENSRIGGHTMGHYLTAAAQALARGYGECKGPDGKTLHQRLEYIIKALEECQQAMGTGFIFGATMADPKQPELQFDKLERSDYNDTWVPWYTMHKILTGLVEVHKNLALVDEALSKQALVIAERLGEWCWRRISKWSPEVRENVVRVEFGGMNDCLYELYRCALADGYKDAEHFWNAAHAFDEEWLFSHPQAIVNRHANTTIPKFVGAANRCMILLEGLGVKSAAHKGSETGAPAQEQAQEAQIYLDYCRNFWAEVVNHHTYITGGNSECEHFGLPDILDAERSNTNCETCNTYNMLKLSRMLFMMTGERKYADYYENTFLNAIMASVNAENAMTTYFQPMATGCFKTYCNPDVDKNFFWCCTGTGLENFTKLGDSFYFYDEEKLYVNMYVSSSVRWDDKHLKLTQKTDISSGRGNSADFTVEFEPVENSSGTSAQAREATLAFRLPDWLAAQAKVTLNGQVVDSVSADISDGYLCISREWKNGDKLSLTLPMTITAHGLQDSAGKTFGFKYGPLVLAAELGGDDNMKHGVVGAQCDVSANKIVGGVEMPLSGNYGGTSNLQLLPGEIVQLKDSSLADFLTNPAEHFELLGGIEPRFHLTGTDFPGEFTFSAYNRLNGLQRYGIYWVFVDSAAAKEVELQNAYKADNSEVFIEGIGVGYGAQTEGNENTYPHLQEKDSVADPHELFRYAKAGGFFSYEFAVKPGHQNYLVCTFLKEDNGKSLCISSDSGVSIANITLDYQGSAEKYSQRFAIPLELTPASDQEKSHLRIKFEPGSPAATESTAGRESARLCAPVKTVYTRALNS